MVAFLLSNFAFQIMFFLFLVVSVASHDFIVDLVRNHPSKSLLSSGSPYSDTFNNNGHYIMKISIGTPPLEITGIVDTGSNFIWTQCMPCESCYKQNDPIFDPSKSSTYKDTQCDNGKRCNYEMVYEDKRYSIGTLGNDVVTLRSTSGEPFTLRNAFFGCGHNNSDGYTPLMSGIIGLGWGCDSLISQLGDSIQGLFSYCLGSEKGKMNFGANAIVSGDGVSSTNLFRKQNDRLYYLNLEAISINKARIDTSGTSFQAKDGNMIIDSGTTLTYLPHDYYLRVKEAFVKEIREKLTAPPKYYETALCYRSQNVKDLPVITMHFTNVDLVLDNANIYIKGDGFQEHCLTFVSLSTKKASAIAVFGNKAQSNFLVGYDTQSEIISFKPTNCNAL